jgi:hypothetical protein
MEKRLHAGNAKEIISMIGNKNFHLDPTWMGATVPSLRIVWWVAAGLAGLALILSILTQEYGLGARPSPSGDVEGQDEPPLTESASISSEEKSPTQLTKEIMSN